MKKLQEQVIFNILYPKQKECLEFLTRNTTSKLALLATGCGKTKVSLSWCENCIENNTNINKIFITCPACKTLDWYLEVQDWQQKGVWCGWKIVKLDATKTNYSTILQSKEKTIFIVSHNMFRSLEKYKKEENFKNIWKTSCIIFDEASILKNISSNISKLMWIISKEMNHKNCIYLTATATSNKQSDIYLLLKLTGIEFGWANNLYMDMQNFNNHFIEYKIKKVFNPWKHKEIEIKNEIGLQKEHEKEFFDLAHLNGYTLTLKELKEQAPVLNFETKYIENPQYFKVQKKLRLMMFDGLKTKYDKSKLKPVDKEYEPLQCVMPTQCLMYERMLASGFVANSQIKNFKGLKIENPKLDQLKLMLENTNENVLVFYNFQQECDDIEAMIKKDLPNKKIILINGKNKYTKSKELLDSIKTQEENYVAICHPLSAGIGVNLDSFSKMLIFYSLPISFQDYTQVIGRINRATTKTPCYYYHLIIKNSIEEEIFNTLKNNQSYSDKMYQNKLNINKE